MCDVPGIRIRQRNPGCATPHNNFWQRNRRVLAAPPSGGGLRSAEPLPLALRSFLLPGQARPCVAKYTFGFDAAERHQSVQRLLPHAIVGVLQRATEHRQRRTVTVLPKAVNQHCAAFWLSLLPTRGLHEGKDCGSDVSLRSARNSLGPCSSAI